MAEHLVTEHIRRATIARARCRTPTKYLISTSRCAGFSFDRMILKWYYEKSWHVKSWSFWILLFWMFYDKIYLRVLHYSLCVFLERTIRCRIVVHASCLMILSSKLKFRLVHKSSNAWTYRLEIQHGKSEFWIVSYWPRSMQRHQTTTCGGVAVASVNSQIVISSTISQPWRTDVRTQ